MQLFNRLIFISLFIETVQAAKAASIKIRTDSGVRLKWIRKRPSKKYYNRLTGEKNFPIYNN